MRKNRVVEQNRFYHLVSRLAHRAFFLDDEEKDRAVALMRRVEEFSGVVVLAYAFMSNHFHIFIYMPSAERRGVVLRFGKGCPRLGYGQKCANARMCPHRTWWMSADYVKIT